MKFLRQINRSSYLFSGITVLIVLAVIYGGSLWQLLQYSQFSQWKVLFENRYLWQVIRFSFYQAGLSAILALFFGLLVARALFYLEFRGKNLLLKLFSLTYVLPALVAIFGIIGIYGFNGWINQMLRHFQLQLPDIYGLSGILLAHLFFNIPLSAKVLHQRLSQLPVSQFKLAAQLNLQNWHFFRWVELPFIRPVCFSLFGLIFLLCFTSFTIVLTLGGGPKYTTLEVAIYQAITFDFDIETAALLAILQFVFCFILFTINSRFARYQQAKCEYQEQWCLPLNKKQRYWHCSVLLVAILFIAMPLLETIIAGLTARQFWQQLLQPELWQAVMFSLLLAPTSAVLSLGLSIALLLTTRQLYWREQRKVSQLLLNIGTIILAVPTLVLATGLFLLLGEITADTILLFLLVALCNALVAMPFVLQLLTPAFYTNMLNYQRLCLSLNLRGWQRWQIIEKTTLIRPLRAAFALAAAISLGDFTAIALFGNDSFTSLPLLLYRQLGHYQSDGAAVTAMILLLFYFVIFLFTEQNDEHN
ncbi:thiamine/thiamine pyrophosphate ABC transporter permease ThiP [Gallibacterium trehalosifermentans]|uniref:Thiamine transport system permease protein ThiP n=1 Tax=Gallibacterium trehalosifermentans TaxID=516935 RepID=A0ABV6GXX1_9PAST